MVTKIVDGHGVKKIRRLNFYPDIGVEKRKPSGSSVARNAPVLVKSICYG
jgi:hypothetical protein